MDDAPVLVESATSTQNLPPAEDLTITEKVMDWLTESSGKLLIAIAIVVAGYFVAKIVSRIVKKMLQKARVEETLVSFISSIAYISVITFAVLAGLAYLGIETTSFIAVLGAAGLAVGLALQGSLANFAAGVLMIIFRPLKVGDFVEGGGVTGFVEEVGIFATELKTPDNKKIIIPNAKLTGDNIINYSAKEIRRVDIVAGVSYGDDIDKVKGVLNQILSEDERILDDPAPRVAVLELGDSSVNFAVRPWVKTTDYWDVFFDTQEKIKKRFDAEGISIPFPQRDVHLFNEG